MTAPRRSRALSLVALVMSAAATPGRAAEPSPPPAEPAPTDEEGIPTGIADRITQAESAFRVQNYPRVIQLLDRLVGHPKLEGRPEHVKVLEWLGAAHWFTGAKDAARLAFGQLLRESPFHALDAFVYPELLIAFFEERRKELVNFNIIPGRPSVAPTREVVLRTVTEHDVPTLAYFAPFGVGQFANDEDGKGTAFAAIHGVTAVLMIATWIGIETLKVDGSDDILIGDGDREARLLNGIFIGSFGVFAASWAFSIVDGLANQRAPTVREERVKMLPSDVVPESSSTNQPSGPIFGPGPGDFGVGLGVRF